MAELRTPLACALAGAACGIVGCEVLRRLARPRKAAAGGNPVTGKDFQGKPSTYMRSGDLGCVVALLGYDISETLTTEEYDDWLFNVHYHDLLANPHLMKIVLHTVDKDKEVKLSSGQVVKNEFFFSRMAELYFKSYSAYDEYIKWFQANAIQPPRTPAGKTVFKFYWLSHSEAMFRPPTPQPSPALATKQAPATTVRTAGKPAVLVVGSTGSIGREVVRLLRERGDVSVVEASRKPADERGLRLDITDDATVGALDQTLPDGVDHVVVCCGTSIFGPVESFDDGKWVYNLVSKLGAVSRLVIKLANGRDLRCLRDSGSITITTGQAGGVVNRMWPGLATNNAGLDAFVRCAGVQAPRGTRINAVSPCLVTETAVQAGLPLEGTVSAAEAASKFVPLIFGPDSGKVVLAGEQTTFETSHQKTKEDGPASKI